mmetsp:Transcript_21996/g.61278  ORF Transcript_21996/g.61278 Transcript_21996/m.61278 type:complete len:400 (-) Transcript_21996:503-1702(-)
MASSSSSSGPLPGGSGSMSASGTASATATITQQAQSSSSSSQTAPTLHLILQPRPQHNVTWTEDTIDNEHLNRKKSKKCCIYKKPQNFGESSSSSGSDDEGAARPSGWKRKGRPDRMCPFGQPADRDGLGDGDGDGGGGGGGFAAEGSAEKEAATALGRLRRGGGCWSRLARGCWSRHARGCRGLRRRVSGICGAVSHRRRVSGTAVGVAGAARAPGGVALAGLAARVCLVSVHPPLEPVSSAAGHRAFRPIGPRGPLAVLRIGMELLGVRFALRFILCTLHELQLVAVQLGKVAICYAHHRRHIQALRRVFRQLDLAVRVDFPLRVRLRGRLAIPKLDLVVLRGVQAEGRVPGPLDEAFLPYWRHGPLELALLRDIGTLEVFAVPELNHRSGVVSPDV